MKKILFLMLLFCLKPTLSFAESCTSLPDCEKLGYYLGYNAACGTDDSRYIFCPYDVRYRKCVNYDCANMGFTADDKSAWCRNIVTCKFDEAYTLCADSYEIGATCTPVECTAVTIPSENAHGTVKCQPKAADCSTGEPVYTAWACDIGFHEQNGACVANCPIVNCPAGITPPENATCTSKCSSVSSSCVTGQEVCLSYSCNSGFHAEGGLCLPDPVCTPITCTAVERPAHSHGTTQCIPTASDCSTQAPVYTDWACDTNYHKDGNTCQKDCSIKTCTAVTVPENGRCKTTCKSQNASCVEGSEVCVEWECLPNFHKQGDTCQQDCALDTCSPVGIPANAHGTTQCIPNNSDCSPGEPVFTDWECNSGFHKKSGMCEQNCSVQTCTQVTPPSNATCSAFCQSQDANCDKGGQVCVAWECDEGYHKDGNTCVVNQTCSKVTCTPADIPANASGTTQCTPQETDCSTGTTVYTAWECNNGYHKKNNTCEKDCAVETCAPAVTVPENGYCKTTCKTKDTSCNQSADICTEFACNDGYRKEGNECVLRPVCDPEICTPSDVPANAHGTSQCTPKNADCSTGNPVYTGWECDSNYHEKNGGCEHDCPVVNCSQISIPQNAHGTTQCTAQAVDCSTNDPVYTAWACDLGYHEKNGGCEQDCQPNVCSAVNVPANAHGTSQCTAQYMNCATEDPVYTAWECDNGFHEKNGGCEQDCQVVNCVAVSVPSHAHGTTQCTNKGINCSTGSTVYVDWECNAGYHKEGNACVENDCAYMNTVNGTNYVSSPATDYDCQTRALIRVNNGAREILCYSATVDNSACICNEDYATSDNGCGTGKVLDLNIAGNYAFGDRCYFCVCDQANGYYDTCPTGAKCNAPSNGCYKTTGCADDYVRSNTTDLQYYITSGEQTFNVSGTDVTCVKPVSCNETLAVSDTSTSITYFNFISHNLAGISCYSPISCKSPYDNSSSSSNCSCGEIKQFAKSFNNLHCYKCEDIVCSTGVPSGTNYIDADGINYGPLSWWTAENMGLED